ncbi:MAG: polyamine aminopropyltransferase [Thermoprotei archaeon]|nr:polyamine aminopropyltransferase [Thermoprotei archaeon]
MASGIANNKDSNWRFIVEWSSKGLGILHEVKRVIFSGHTKYQDVDLVETPTYGICLFLDGKLQTSSADEWMYHEALVHPIMLTHPNPRRVMIIGGGEGITLREVLKHNTVESVEMVDIDEEIIELCKQYLKALHRGSFDDPRVKLVIEDGRKYLSAKHNDYDVIIVDATDPLKGSPSVPLYTKEFYEIVFDALRDEGLMVTQATSTFYTIKTFTTICNTLKAVFPIVRPYQVWVPGFNSLWGFVIGSKRYDPVALSEEEVRERLHNRGVKDKLRLYHPGLHKALFALPLFLEERINSEKDIATDDKPVYVD